MFNVTVCMVSWFENFRDTDLVLQSMTFFPNAENWCAGNLQIVSDRHKLQSLRPKEFPT